MADIQTQLPVKLTDGTNTAAITGASALKVDASGATQPVSGTVTSVPSGTQTVTGTVTNVPSGTTTVAYGTGTFVTQDTASGPTDPGTASAKSLLTGMVYNTAAPAPTNGQQLALQSDSSGNLKVAGNLTTVPSGTQTVAYGSGTFPVSGTVTNVPSGTQTIAGTVTAVGSGTFTVSVSNNPTVTIGATSVTQPVSGTITTNAESTIGAGTAPSRALVGGLTYNTAAPTLTNGQTAALQGDANANLKVALTGTSTVTTVPSGTQTVAGTVTNVPSGTQTVAGTVTNVPSGTQTVAGTVTAVGSGTFTVSVSNNPTVTIGATSVTQPVSGTITTNAESTIGAGTAPSRALVGGLVYNSTSPTLTDGQTAALQGDVNGNLKVAGSISVVPETTGVVTSYSSSTTVAAASTGTISYTVTSGKSLYWKGVMASSSGAPCKVTVDYGAGPTTVCVAFYSSASPFLNIVFPQPLIIAASTVVNVKIQNNAGASQDVYATIFGAEH